MAKGKKGRARAADPMNGGAASSSAPATTAAGKELDQAIKVFATGDYARARNMLVAKASDPSLSEGAKEHARELIAATRIERGTLYVGLACIALAVLTVVVTSMLQP
jgi:hypothetical protein